MTVHDGRRAPGDGPPSLFDHARRLLARHPEGPLPHGGRPFPDEAAYRTDRADPLSAAAARRLLHDTLTWFFAQPPPRPVAELHARLLSQPARRRIRGPSTDDLPGPAEDRRAAGLWLVRHATDRRAAGVGLTLLRGTARPGDAPVVRAVGLLGPLLGVLAVDVLRRLPDAGPDLTWLAERLTGCERSSAVEALCDRPDPVTSQWLLRHGLSVAEDGEGSHQARRVADVTDLGTVLRADRLDVEVVRHAARVLLTMAGPRYEPVQVADWPGAADAVADLARHLAAGPATLDDAAYAARLAEELRSGHLATLDRLPDRRATLIGTLTAVARRGLDGPRPVTDARVAWRVDWLRRVTADAGEPPPAPDGPVNRLRLRVVVPDPALPADVQLRPLVDGEPVTARAFTRGQPAAPEGLLGRLPAGTEPQEVMLAEAGCTEGCCGALRVTVDRDGDQVRWHRWRSPGRDDPLPAFRFDAGAYAAELDRVEHDHGWEWPARTLARLLRERLAAEPDLLGRWDCRLSWAHAWASERDRLEVSFLHPNRRIRQDLPFLQFRLVLRPAGHPADQAASFVDRLRDTDPKRDAEIVGGSREYAEQLGFRWPQPGSCC